MRINLEKWMKRSEFQWTLRILFALGMTISLAQFEFHSVEFFTKDLRMKWTPRPQSSGNILLVPIDEESVKRFGGPPSLAQFNQTLEGLVRAQPHAVITTINPTLLQAEEGDLIRLASLSERLKLIIAENDLPPTGQTEFTPFAAPLDNIQRMAAPKTSDRAVFAKDGVTRRMILKYEGNQTLYPKVASDFRRGAMVTANGQFLFLDSEQLYIRFHDPKSYPVIEFSNIMNDRWDSLSARGKIVLLGLDTKDSFDQYVTSPLSQRPFDTGHLYIHADSIETLVLDDAPKTTPAIILYLSTFIVGLLTIVSVLTLRPITGLTVLLSTVVGLFSVGLLAFYIGDIMIPLSQPLLAIFLCYYFVIPYRLIIENRKSWEYYQKNRILTQVEELKSNFLRLMSHDLKTPLAKIQGMAEILKKEPDRLSSSQSKALEEIMASGDELEDFVSSILNLTRVESKEIKLQLHSRDVNRILEHVIERCSYLAERKNITITKELEPLFSLKIDEDLMRQVFTNLIENAIKYSPENTKILVSTEDIPGGVMIQVADQGVGLSEEDLKHVFEKFYRSPNVEHGTHGTGLGLYLAKYFVELHSGMIQVESEINKGSTFSVFLPYELETQVHQGGPHA